MASRVRIKMIESSGSDLLLGPLLLAAAIWPPIPLPITQQDWRPYCKTLMRLFFLRLICPRVQSRGHAAQSLRATPDGDAQDIH